MRARGMLLAAVAVAVLAVGGCRGGETAPSPPSGNGVTSSSGSSASSSPVGGSVDAGELADIEATLSRIESELTAEG